MPCRHASDAWETPNNTCNAGAEIEALWHEYEAGATPEAQLVKDFDKARALWFRQACSPRTPANAVCSRAQVPIAGLTAARRCTHSPPPHTLPLI